MKEEQAEAAFCSLFDLTTVRPLRGSDHAQLHLVDVDSLGSHSQSDLPADLYELLFLQLEQLIQQGHYGFVLSSFRLSRPRLIMLRFKVASRLDQTSTSITYCYFFIWFTFLGTYHIDCETKIYPMTPGRCTDLSFVGPLFIPTPSSPPSPLNFLVRRYNLSFLPVLASPVSHHSSRARIGRRS